MIQVHKILHSESLSNAVPILKLSDYHSTRGHDLKLIKETCNSDKRKFSFSQRVVLLWNNLPANTANAPDTNRFKILLDENLKNMQYDF